MDLGGEAELVGDIGDCVTVVVDVDLVQHVVAEAEVVGATAGLLEAEPVGDQRHRVGCVGCDEGVDVGVVGRGIIGDEGRLPVAGGIDGDERRHREGGAEATSQEYASARWT